MANVANTSACLCLRVLFVCDCVQDGWSWVLTAALTKLQAATIDLCGIKACLFPLTPVYTNLIVHLRGGKKKAITKRPRKGSQSRVPSTNFQLKKQPNNANTKVRHFKFAWLQEKTNKKTIKSVLRFQPLSLQLHWTGNNYNIQPQKGSRVSVLKRYYLVIKVVIIALKSSKKLQILT